MKFIDDNELLFRSREGVSRLTIDTFVHTLLFETKNRPDKIAISPDGVIAVGYESSVEYWRKNSNRYELRRTIAIEGTIRNLKFSPANGWLLVGTDSELISMDAAGTAHHRMSLGGREWMTLATHGELAAILFRNGSVEIWNLAAKRLLQSIPSVFDLVAANRDASSMEFSSVPIGTACASLGCKSQVR